MDDSAVDLDVFSSLDDELISNIKRPSLISLSSEDSIQDKKSVADEPFTYVNWHKTSTPFKVNQSASVNCNETAEYDFKVPPNFSSGKRFSLSVFSENPSTYSMNKSNSMLDVSSISSFSHLRRNSCMYSNETLQSNSVATTKSKDSGFQRSTSCTSLTTSSSKKYDHVQSKVKQYIQTIKQSDALRKMQKRMECEAYREENSSLESPDKSPVSDDVPVSKKDLINKVKELEEELKERDCVIEQLEKNQSELRLKYAAAENKIDDLRIRASHNDDDSANTYITDEKVAELLMSNAKNSGRFTENSIAKQMLKSKKRIENQHYEFSPFVKSTSSQNHDLQPVKKFCSSSIRLSNNYPALKYDGISKSSSYNHVSESKFELSKSASNVEKPMVRFTENDIKNLPYEKNSFAKVQQWQRSLVNLNKANDNRSMNMCCEETNEDTGCCLMDESTDEKHHRKLRRFQKNKDAEKKRNRSSYPVGCKCEKFKKCKSREEVNVAALSPTTNRRGLIRRTVSFADYEDSMTSSLYDDGESSSDSSTKVMNQRHESYKDYKQRKLLEKFGKYGGEGVLAWNEMKKAKSASNLHCREDTSHSRNKRLMDNASSGYEYSCSDRKHCVKAHSKKYRKLDDYNKVASAGCVALTKCRSAHACQLPTGCDLEGKTCVRTARLLHSKSYDEHNHRHQTTDTSHCVDKLECSCLVALENLKIQEHNALAKFAEHLRKHSRKVREKDVALDACKRYSLQK